MYFIWKRSPLLRISMPLFIGILLSEYMVKISSCAELIALLSALISFYILVFYRKVTYQKRHIIGIILTALFLVFGVVLSLVLNPECRDDHYKHFTDEAIVYGVKLKDEPSGSNGYYRCLAEVNYVIAADRMVEVSGLISLQFALDSAQSMPGVDQELWLTAHPEPHTKPLNPGEFNYGAFLERRGILYRMFAQSGQWRISDHGHTRTFIGWLIGIREKLLQSMRENGLEGREYAVLAALLLGKTTDIDKELMMSYSGAGAVHILAVSGLHVALIYVLLGPLFNRFLPGKKYRLLKSLLPMALLWIYAGITGFSPSVLRAALMFSCFIIADNFQKENNIYNTIGASVLLLVIWNPNIAYETGFQLSYLAVLGIVILQKRIVVLYETSNAWLDKAWKLIAVSVAAQIATLPYTLFYFDQFPVWFLLTNLLVIPLSTLILYCGLASFVLLWWKTAAVFAMGLTGFLTRLMNEIMLWIEKLPLAVVDRIHITGWEFVLLSMFTICFCRWIFWYKSKSLFYVLISVLLLEMASILCIHEKSAQSVLCLHSIKKGDALSFTEGRKMIILADSTMLHDRIMMKNYFARYLTEACVENAEYVILDSLVNRNTVMNFSNGITICPVNLNLCSGTTLPSASCYYFGAWLKEARIDIAHPDRFLGSNVIFSSAFSKYAVEKIRKMLPSGIAYHHLRDGALLMEAGDTIRKFEEE